MDEKIILKIHLISATSSSRSIENKYDVYTSKDCMKKSCESLKEYLMMIINLKSKKNEILRKSSRNSMKV